MTMAPDIWELLEQEAPVLEGLGVFADAREMVDWVMACALPSFMDGHR